MNFLYFGYNNRLYIQNNIKYIGIKPIFRNNPGIIGIERGDAWKGCRYINDLVYKMNL